MPRSSGREYTLQAHTDLLAPTEESHFDPNILFRHPCLNTFTFKAAIAPVVALPRVAEPNTITDIPRILIDLGDARPPYRDAPTTHATKPSLP